ncbi:uncharacterized protein zgc:194655 [Siniperca chuatsi]|uniref:uncharacterized protein zgc:194655 n=1 Tax=Siniperca chuatsi TaxID=119488 RepID=UPI001CE0BF73|nr:uncharacterized protein zgc:194655 [Siniperca chuatsi]
MFSPFPTSYPADKSEQHPECRRGITSQTQNRKQRCNKNNSTKMGKIYQVVVNGLRGEKMMIDLCNTEEQMRSMTVLQLKEKIAQKLPENNGEETLRLIFADKSLDEDSKLLSDYGIQHMSLIMIVMRVPGGLTA